MVVVSRIEPVVKRVTQHPERIAAVLREPTLGITPQWPIVFRPIQLLQFRPLGTRNGAKRGISAIDDRRNERSEVIQRRCTANRPSRFETGNVARSRDSRAVGAREEGNDRKRYPGATCLDQCGALTWFNTAASARLRPFQGKLSRPMRRSRKGFVRRRSTQLIGQDGT